MKDYKGIESRNYLVDNLKVILMFAVVFGHTIEHYIDQNYILRGIYIYIYIFHMPLFIFISGYLSKKSVKSNKKIVEKLLIPYLFFNIVWYIGVYIVTGQNMFSIFYPGWTLWYLISLFFWRISLKYLTKIKYIIPIS
ncbi:MAG: acyltransferase family protein, partial [Paraclostridium sp.]